LAAIAMFHDNDMAAAASYYAKALQLEPTNSTLMTNAAALLFFLGRSGQAVMLQEYATARDPLNTARNSNLGTYYFYEGRWDDAIKAYRVALTLSPNVRQVHYSIGLALVLKGQPEAALEEFAQEPDEAAMLHGRVLALYSLGRQQEFEESLAALIESEGEKSPEWIAQAYAWAGDTDAAFEWLNRAIELSAVNVSGQFAEPYFRPMHDDPRWAQFLARTGSTPEQLDAVKFEVSLPR